MELIDSRRLTGPNLVWEKPGALLDVEFEKREDGVLVFWKEEMRAIQKQLGWSGFPLRIRLRRAGAWLVAAGPVDQLYTVIEASEKAWERAVARQKGDHAGQNLEEVEFFRTMADDEKNPAMMALMRKAAAENTTFLWDDDFVSLGLGRHSKTWATDSLPRSEDLDWSEFADIPVAVVTGTNGKSTNVRILRQMVNCWGKVPGTSSTDWIRVGDDILDRGDYSGPGGARTVLRDPRVEVGILEVARGGLLRRGAGVGRANVALITNVAEDHMGQYGIHTLDDLIEAKMIVRHLVREDGVLILNADDEGLVRYAPCEHEVEGGGRICWFSLYPDSDVIRRHTDAGGSVCVVDGGIVVFRRACVTIEICEVADIPLTLQGRATYNVYNCISATAVAFELGIPSEIIREGLLSFQSDPETNPGRGNYFDVGGVTVLLDFAHNQHGLDAILETTEALEPRRRLITLGTAGDRTDREIRNLARSAAEAGVDRILLTDAVGYERELGPGGVPRILYDELMLCDVESENVAVYGSEMDGVRAAFEWAKPGDMLILLVKGEREAALEYIQSKMK